MIDRSIHKGGDGSQNVGEGSLMALGCNPAQKDNNAQEGFGGYLSNKTYSHGHFVLCPWLHHYNFRYLYKLLKFLLRLFPLDATPNFLQMRWRIKQKATKGTCLGSTNVRSQRRCLSVWLCFIFYFRINEITKYRHLSLRYSYLISCKSSMRFDRGKLLQVKTVRVFKYSSIEWKDL